MSKLVILNNFSITYILEVTSNNLVKCVMQPTYKTSIYLFMGVSEIMGIDFTR